jgi:hypothetical protein
MVPLELAGLGTDLRAERPNGAVDAVVVEKPFIDPWKETPKQDLAHTTG